MNIRAGRHRIRLDLNDVFSVLSFKIRLMYYALEIVPHNDMEL